MYVWSNIHQKSVTSFMDAPLLSIEPELVAAIPLPAKRVKNTIAKLNLYKYQHEVKSNFIAQIFPTPKNTQKRLENHFKKFVTINT